MTTSPGNPHDDRDELLPWLVTGTLPPEEAKRVADAVRTDPALEHRYRLAREELTETVGVNERIVPPAARVFDKLFEKIDAEADRPHEEIAPERGPLLPRVISWIGRLTPRTLALAAAAASGIFAVQVAVIAGLWASSGQGTYVVMNEPTGSGGGAFLYVKFVPTVSAADIAAFLRARNVSIVGGPQPNGFFRIKVSDTRLSPEELDRIAAGLKSNPPVVEFTLRAR